MILRRLENSRYSEVIRAWQDTTAVLIGCGPSLTQDQVAQVQLAHQAAKVHCVVINDGYLLAPWGDVLYAADPKWWHWHKDKAELQAFAGERCSIECSGAEVVEPVHALRNRDHPYQGSGLSMDSQMLVTGRHSGFQALNLAILAGAKTILLLGYDGQPAADGKSHFHAGHPKPTPMLAYEEYRRAFSVAESPILAAGVKVINCSPGSAIDSFPKMNLEEALR